MTVLIIFIGAGFGGVLRYGLGGWVQDLGGTAFPWGTLVVNVTGTFLLGFLYAFLEGTAASPGWRAFLGPGLCGGYTTFSTFGYETVRLLQDGQWTRAGLYVAGSVIVSLVAAGLGFQTAAAALQRG